MSVIHILGPSPASGTTSVNLSVTQVTLGSPEHSDGVPQSQNGQVAVNNKSNVRIGCLMRLDFSSIPSGAIITSAQLRVQPFANSSTTLPVRASLLARDGVWDAVSGATSGTVDAYKSADTVDFEVAFYSGANGTGSVIADTGVTVINGSSMYVRGFGIPLDLDTIAQAVLVGAGGNVQSVGFRLQRAGGSPPGNCRLKLYSAQANNGSDDRPDQLLRTSSDVAITSIPSASPGGEVFFNITTLATTAATRYVAEIEVDYTSGFIVFGKYDASSPAPYATGSALGSSPNRYAFHSACYMTHDQHPTALNELGLAHVAPFGGVQDFNMPSFSSGVWVTVADLGALVQEWVDGPGFTPDVLGISLVPTAAATSTASRFWNSMQLVVEVQGINEEVAAALSGQVSLDDPEAAVNRGLDSSAEAVAQFAPEASVARGLDSSVEAVAQFAPEAGVARGLAAGLSIQAQFAAQLERIVGLGLSVDAVAQITATAQAQFAMAVDLEAQVEVVATLAATCSWFEEANPDWFTMGDGSWFTMGDGSWFNPKECN